jgi:hypothetical protein
MSKYEREASRVRIEYFIIQPANGKGNAVFKFGRDAALRRPWRVACNLSLSGRRSAPSLP